jgi:hypothetical protein
VPDRHVIPTGVAVVVVVVPLVGVWLSHVDALPVGVGRRRRDARDGRGRNGERCGGGCGGGVIGCGIIVAAPAAPTAPVRVVSSPTITTIVARLSRRIASIWSGCIRRDGK